MTDAVGRSAGADPARRGGPVSGLSAAEVVSQIAWRALGPVGGRARVVLDWAGLAGRPATRQADVAARHRVNPSTLRSWVRQVTADGQTVPLRHDIAATVSRASLREDDHLARTRQAALLGLVAPTRIPVAPFTPGHREWAATAGRMLATVGPLPVEVLHGGVLRTRRARASGPPPDRAMLVAAMQRSGIAYFSGDRWHLRTLDEPVAPPRFAALVAGARSSGRRTYTTAQMQALLTAAGYRAVTGNSLRQHPLIERLSRDCWRVITDAPSSEQIDLPS